MDNTQALDTLKAKLAANEVGARDLVFVTSLVTQSEKRGLSEKQWYWVVTLAERLVAPPTPPKAVPVFDKVYAMFAKAKQHLRFPKITLSLPNNLAVKLYVSGQRSRVPDTINVVGVDTGVWYGRVHASGAWEVGKGTSEENAAVEALLTRLAADPERVATEYGKLTGACCFCNRSLKDERSTEVGYGPVCAQRFGLVWGHKG